MTFLYYIVPVVIIILGAYIIYTNTHRSQANRDVKSTGLSNAPVLFKTQEVNFDIKSYPVTPGNIFLKNTSPAYYLDKQQLIITEKGLLLSAVVSGKEYAQRSFYFNSADLSEKSLRLSDIEYLIESWSEEKDKLSIKTKEQKYLFIPKYAIVDFKKYPKELAEIIKRKVSNAK